MEPKDPLPWSQEAVTGPSSSARQMRPRNPTLEPYGAL